MKRSSKFLLVIFFWGVFLSWYLRVFPVIEEPGITGGFGAIHDWPRFHLVRTGTRSNIPSGLTETSAKMDMPIDLTTYFLAMYTIISGNIKLSSGLTMLKSLPNLLYFIPAFLGVSFYKRINAGSNSKYEIGLLFVLGLFISPVFISYTDMSINQAGYGICIYSILLYIIYSILEQGSSPRWVGLFSIFSGIMAAIYHTYGLISIFIVPSYYILEHSSFRFALTQNKFCVNNSSRKSMLLFISVTAMTTVGLYYSTVVPEIGWNLTQMFLVASESAQSYKSAQVGVFRSVLVANLSLEFASRISKFFIYIIYSIFIMYFLRILFNKSFQFNKSSGVFLLLLLTLYPIVFVMFFSYGGIGVAVQRTAAAGSPVIIFIVGYILSEKVSLERKRIIQSVIAFIIILAIVTQLPMLQEPPQYTEEEKVGIQFTGEYVETSQMVFSDSRLGGSLLYYNHRGIVYVRVIRADWEQRLRNIYFAENPQQTRKAIIKTIKYHSKSEVDKKSIRDHYILISKRMTETGIRIETHSYRKKPTDKYHTTFDSRYNRIYHSGDGLIYLNP
ncbi:hypothetical protein Hbl1158_06460 [Halobaculum sp. CBA1158]|uniref:hypothetical protein n=1 Tax=Halobaculum sp. CBA1158 TaxID=2904243 RepID=UPI001F2AA5AC|nr:hypothetical protein [Halobaculum sp. CBA1158]UIP00995.1 hypothetical protein Hbl1158_06460 [Halobaculum sp. CBA1158]